MHLQSKMQNLKPTISNNVSHNTTDIHILLLHHTSAVAVDIIQRCISKTSVMLRARLNATATVAIHIFSCAQCYPRIL